MQLLNVKGRSGRHALAALIAGLMQFGVLGACAARDAVSSEREIRFDVLSELVDKHMDACADVQTMDLESLTPDYLFFQLALVGSIMTGEIGDHGQRSGHSSHTPDLPSTLFDDMVETCAVMNQRTCLFGDIPRCQNVRKAFVRICRGIAFCQEQCRQQGVSACDLTGCASDVLEACPTDLHD